MSIATLSQHAADFLAMAPAPTAVGPDGKPAAPGWTQFIFPVLLIAIFYFLLIRPQMKARKEQDKLIASIESGDRVVTSSGILGVVTNVKEKTVLVKIADGVKIEILKSAVASVTKGDAPVEPQVL